MRVASSAVRVVAKSSDRRHELRKAKAGRATNAHDVSITRMKLGAGAAVGLVVLLFSCGPDGGGSNSGAPTVYECINNPGSTFLAMTENPC